MVERTNQTVKDLLRKVPEAFPHQWDCCIDPLLFALHEAPHFSTGLSPFDMLLGWKPRSLVQDIQDCWVPPEQTPGRLPTDHFKQTKKHLDWARQTATSHLLAAQDKQKRDYDKQVSLHSFQVGERVLVHSLLFPRQATSEWEGPFTVTQVLGPVNYDVRCGPIPYRLKALHVNHLKKWHAPAKAISTVAWSEVQPSPL